MAITITARPCPDTDLEINGTPEGSFTAGSTIDLQLTDGVNPVTPVSVGRVGDTVTVEVPAGGACPIGAPLIVSGQTTVYNSHDDGDKKRGRLVDFITLNQNNPFGNDRRFTGITGGSYNGTNWVDVDNNTVASRLAAFPHYIFLDWSTDSGTDVLGYCFEDWYVAVPDKTFIELCEDGNSFSIGIFTSGWSGVNDVEARNIMNRGSALALNYYPLNINSSIVFNTITTNPQTTANCFVLANNWGSLSGTKTGARKVIYTRLITYAELGL
jgi:hypothetical protein